MFETFPGVHKFEDILFILDANGHVRGNGVRETAGFVDTGNRGQYFRRDFFIQLHILLKLAQGRAAKDIQFTFIHLASLQYLHRGGKHFFSLGKFLNTGPLGSLDQDLDGPVRQLQQLQDIGQCPDLINLFNPGVILRRALLRDQQYLFVAFHRLVQGGSGFLPPHKQGYNHMGIDHYIPQGQDRVNIGFAFRIVLHRYSSD